MREVLLPRLRAGQIVLMDLIEQKGCQLWPLPSYSPDMSARRRLTRTCNGLVAEGLSKGNFRKSAFSRVRAE
jgi:hypothetical protein